MSIHKEFVDYMEAFLDSTDYPPTHLGINALNNPGFVTKIRKGASCTLKTADRVIDFINHVYNQSGDGGPTHPLKRNKRAKKDG